MASSTMVNGNPVDTAIACKAVNALAPPIKSKVAATTLFPLAAPEDKALGLKAGMELKADPGGIGTSGDILVAGQGGEGGGLLPNSYSLAGSGGSSALGGGSRGTVRIPGMGAEGGGAFGGGGGGGVDDSTNGSGGNGAAGVVVVEVFT